MSRYAGNGERPQLPDITFPQAFYELKIEIIDARKLVSDLAAEADGLRADYQHAVVRQDFVGQSRLTGSTADLPARIAAATCRLYELEGRLAKMELEIWEDERPKMWAQVNEADERLRQAQADKFHAVGVHSRIESRQLALRDQVRDYANRAATIAHEATEVLSRDASALLTAA